MNDPSFHETIGDVILRAQNAGVTAFVVPAYDRESLARTLELAKKYPGTVFAAFGIHPWFLEGADLNEVKSYLRSDNAVAIGEVGLDFSQGMPHAGTQERYLVSQLDMAAEFSLPVLIHCRHAYERMYDILAGYKDRVRVIMHSFSASSEIMKRFLRLGCFISFSGAVTRDNARKYHRCAEIVPSDRFVLETDAPSIATQNTVASAVEPRHVSEIAAKLALIRHATYSDICSLSTSNARQFFGIEIPVPP